MWCSSAEALSRTASSLVAVPVAAAWLPAGIATAVLDGIAAELAAAAELVAGVVPKPAKENAALDGAGAELVATAEVVVTLGGARL